MLSDTNGTAVKMSLVQLLITNANVKILFIGCDGGAVQIPRLVSVGLNLFVISYCMTVRYHQLLFLCVPIIVFVIGMMLRLLISFQLVVSHHSIV